MQVTETLAEGLKRELKVIVAAADIEEKVNAKLAEVAQTLSLPGFRPGKVPMPLIKKKYGDSVRGEVLERVVNEGSGKAIMDRSLKPALQPKVEIGKYDNGGDLEFTLSVEILPDVPAVDFSSIQLERLKATAPDSEVDNALERIAKSRQNSEPVTEARPAASGDILSIDFLGRVDGEAFDGGKAEDYPLELGSNSFIAGFEDQLVGAKAGDKKVVKVTFPTEYGASHLAGKDAEFEVTVKELRRAIPAPIDDELAKSMGRDSVDALKTAIREELERDFVAVSRIKVKRKLLDKLSEMVSFEVPPGMVDGEFNGIWSQWEAARKAGQADDADKDKSDDELKAEYRVIAERRVRLGILLADIGQKNNIQIGQEDLNRALANEARRYPGQEAVVFNYYRSNPEALESLKGPIFEDKVIDFILEMAKTSERVVTPDELMKDDDEGQAAESDSKPKKKAAKEKAGEEA